MNSSYSDLWLCLHFPCLALEAFSRDKTREPVVVTVRNRVIALNEAALSSGIQPGNSMDTAYSLAERVTNFEKNADKEFAILEHLAQWAYQFTPNVTIKAPDCLLLDISGCLKLFGGLDKLVARVSSNISALGYSVVTGVNLTPLAAIYSAINRKSPNVHEQVAEVLKDMPVSCLKVDTKVHEALRQMGVDSLGQLLTLPTKGLNRRFGIFFVDHLQRLTGEKPDPQKFISEAVSFHRDITFIPEVSNLESLVFPVRRLVSELSDFLIGRQLHVSRFTFQLAHRNAQAKHIHVHLAVTDNDPEMFLMLTQLQLEKVDDVPEVDNLKLSVAKFYPAEAESYDLFDGKQFQQQGGQSKAQNDNANRFLNMLRARLGPQRCFGLSHANDHRPEKAWKTIRLNQRDYWFPDDTAPNPRPLFLLNSPGELSLYNGKPGLNGELRLIRGPERIDSGWWDGTPSCRDYYIARHSSGILYWIFRHEASGKWFLHGIFS